MADAQVDTDSGEESDDGEYNEAQIKELRKLEDLHAALTLHLHIASCTVEPGAEAAEPENLFAVVLLDEKEVGRTQSVLLQTGMSGHKGAGGAFANAVFALQLPEVPWTARVRVEVWREHVADAPVDEAIVTAEAVDDVRAAIMSRTHENLERRQKKSPRFVGETVIIGKDLLKLREAPQPMPLLPSGNARTMKGAPPPVPVGQVNLARIVTRTLVVQVRRAEDLIQTDDFGGENDVYPVVRLHTPEGSSVVAKLPTHYDSLSPAWAHAANEDEDASSEDGNAGSDAVSSGDDSGDNDDNFSDSFDDFSDEDEGSANDVSSDKENNEDNVHAKVEAIARVLLPVELETAAVTIELWSSEMERDDCFLGELRCFCVRPEGEEAPEVTENRASESRGSEGEDAAERSGNEGIEIDAEGPIYVTELPHPSGRILTRALAPKPQAEVVELAQQGQNMHNNFVGGDIEVALCVEQDSPQRNIMTEIVDLQSQCHYSRALSRELGIQLCSCADLAMVDPKSARNPDPFLRAWWTGVGNEERMVRETPSYSNSVDPHWDCEILRLRLPLQIREASLRVEVWDVDKGTESIVCLGEACIDGEELLKLMLRKETEVPLRPQRAGSASAIGGQGMFARENPCEDYLEERKMQESYVQGVLRVRRVEFAQMQVRVSHARDLADTDVSEEHEQTVLSRARVKCLFNEHALGCSAFARNDQVEHECVWSEYDETFSFHVPLHLKSYEPKLLIEVWDRLDGAEEKAFAAGEKETQESFLGQLQFLPDEAFVLPEGPQMPPQLLELQKKDNTLKFTKFVTGELAVGKARVNEVEVRVCDASGLLSPTKPSVFFVANYKGREIYRSTVFAQHQKSWRPRWPNEVLLLLMPSEADELHDPKYRLHIELWHEDSDQGNDFLGEVFVTAAELLQPNGRVGFELKMKEGVDEDLMANAGGMLYMQWSEKAQPAKSHHEVRAELLAAEAAARKALASEDANEHLPNHWRWNAKEPSLWCAAQNQRNCAEGLLLARHDTYRRDKDAHAQLMLPSAERNRINRNDAQERRDMGRKPRRMEHWRERLRLPALEFWWEKWLPEPNAKIDRSAYNGRTRQLTALTWFEVSEVLRSLGMDDYVESFQDPAREGGRVDGLQLSTMDNKKLIAMGMTFKPHRKTLLSLLSLWRSKGVPRRHTGIYIDSLEEVFELLPSHQSVALTHLSILPMAEGTTFDAHAALAIAGPPLAQALGRRAMVMMLSVFFWVWKHKYRTGLERWRRKTARLAEKRAELLAREQAKEEQKRKAEEAAALEAARKAQEAMEAAANKTWRGKVKGMNKSNLKCAGGLFGNLRASLKRDKGQGHDNQKALVAQLPSIGQRTDAQALLEPALGLGALADHTAFMQVQQRQVWWRRMFGSKQAPLLPPLQARRNSVLLYEQQRHRFDTAQEHEKSKRKAKQERKQDRLLREEAQRKYAKVVEKDRERKELLLIEERRKGLIRTAKADLALRPHVLDARHGLDFVDMMQEVEKLRGKHSGFDEGKQDAMKELQRQQNAYRKRKNQQRWTGSSGGVFKGGDADENGPNLNRRASVESVDAMQEGFAAYVAARKKKERDEVKKQRADEKKRKKQKKKKAAASGTGGMMAEESVELHHHRHRRHKHGLNSAQRQKVIHVAMHEALHELHFHHLIDVSNGVPRRMSLPSALKEMARTVFQRLPPEEQEDTRLRMLGHFAAVLGRAGRDYAAGHTLEAQECWRREHPMMRLVVEEHPVPERLQRVFADAAWDAHALLCELLPVAERRPFFGRCRDAAHAVADGQREAQLLGVIAALERGDGDLDAAKAHVHDSFALYVNALDNFEEQEETWSPMDTLGEVEILRGATDAGISTMDKTAFLRIKVRGASDPQLADKLFENAGLLVEHKAYDKALRMYARCLRSRFLASEGNEFTTGIAAVLMNMAVVERKRGNQFEAMALFERYMMIQKKLAFVPDDITGFARTRLLPGFSKVLF